MIRKNALKVLTNLVIWNECVSGLNEFLEVSGCQKSQVNEGPHYRSVSETAIMSKTHKKNGIPKGILKLISSVSQLGS